MLRFYEINNTVKIIKYHETYPRPLAHLLARLREVTCLGQRCANEGAHAGPTYHVNRNAWKHVIKSSSFSA